MGQLCSCHRAQKYDKGYLIDNAPGWKADASLLRKVRHRCSYLRRSRFPVSNNSPLPVQPTEKHQFDGDSTARPEVGDDDDDVSGLVAYRLRSYSSPSSPAPKRSAPPKPPRMRSMLVDEVSGPRQEDDEEAADVDGARREQLGDTRRRASTSELDSLAASGYDITFHSKATFSGDDCATSGSGVDRLPAGWGGSSADDISKHVAQLLVASGVQPEVLVDYLRRRDVINDETCSAVRRCATRRTACELLAEVVASKDRPEMAALCAALRSSAGSAMADFADCLEAVDALIRLLARHQRHRCCCNLPSTQNASHTGLSCMGETGNDITPRCSLNVDVVYVTSPSTGSSGGANDNTSGRDVMTSAVHNRRHHSMFIDPDTFSLPPVAPCLTTSGSGDKETAAVPIVSVSLSNACLDDQLADTLSEALGKFRSFRMISFVKCHRLGPCLARLVRSAAGDARTTSAAGNQLYKLDARLCHVDEENDGDVDALADFLATICRSSLRELCLNGCGISSAGCSRIVSRILPGSRCLADVDVGFNDISDVGALADALAGNCSLRRLRMRGNAIGMDGARRVFDALRRNYRLELLDISGNSIGRSRSPTERSSFVNVEERQTALWRSLAEALLCNRTLRELNLERCALGVDACAALSRALRANTTLTALDLSINPDIGDLGVTLLAGALRHNARCAVQTLSLNMCAVGDAGFRSLLEAIRHESGGRDAQTRLTRIKLCYNLIGCSSSNASVQRSSSMRTSQATSLHRRASTATPTSSRLYDKLDRPPSLQMILSSDVKNGSGFSGLKEAGIAENALVEGVEVTTSHHLQPLQPIVSTASLQDVLVRRRDVCESSPGRYIQKSATAEQSHHSGRRRPGLPTPVVAFDASLAEEAIDDDGGDLLDVTTSDTFHSCCDFSADSGLMLLTGTSNNSNETASPTEGEERYEAASAATPDEGIASCTISHVLSQSATQIDAVSWKHSTPTITVTHSSSSGRHELTSNESSHAHVTYNIHVTSQPPWMHRTTTISHSATGVHKSSSLSDSRINDSLYSPATVPSYNSNANHTCSPSSYDLLCEVLKANPRLKILLWGNELATVRTENSCSSMVNFDSQNRPNLLVDVGAADIRLGQSPVADGGISPRDVIAAADAMRTESFDRMQRGYATLPRNYAPNHCQLFN